VVDNEVDNARRARLGAAATVLAQAAALARVGAVAEAEALIGAARGLLSPRAEVVPLEIAKVFKTR
jgi:hypothetical protein